MLLWAAWSDGTYLTAWPRAAVVLPVAVFLFGLVEGATRWTFVILQGDGLRWGITYVGHGPYVTVFVELLPLLILASFLGPVSANLGLMLSIGYAIGDFLFFDPQLLRDDIVHRVLVLHVPQLICFILFLLLSVWPVVATKFLAAGAVRRLGSRSDGVQALVSAAVLAAFVYEWTYFAPMLFRVAWVWQGSTSPFTVVFFHDFTMPLLVAATIAGVLLRYWLSHRAEQNALAALRVRATALVAQAQTMPRAAAPWLGAILGAAYLTLLIAGFLDSVVLGAVIFGGVAAFFLIRAYVLREVWNRWSRVITRYPALLRLAAGVAGAWVITRIVLSLPRMGASQNAIPGKFGVEVLCLLLGFLLITVLLPNGVLTLEESAAVRDDARLPVSQAAIQVGSVIALMLLASKKALAQGICADPSCCFQGNNGAAAAATSAAAPSAAAGADGGPSLSSTLKDKAGEKIGEGIGKALGGVLGGALGGIIGSAIGGTEGGAEGGAIGGVVGSAVEPGGGTAVGAAVGGAAGAAAGGTAGLSAGTVAGVAIGERVGEEAGDIVGAAVGQYVADGGLKNISSSSPEYPPGCSPTDQVLGDQGTCETPNNNLPSGNDTDTSCPDTVSRPDAVPPRGGQNGQD